jgi:hypothetical protein
MTEQCTRQKAFFRHCQWEAHYDYKGPSKALRNQILYAVLIDEWLANLGVEKRTLAGVLCKTCSKYIPREGEKM